MKSQVLILMTISCMTLCAMDCDDGALQMLEISRTSDTQDSHLQLREVSGGKKHRRRHQSSRVHQSRSEKIHPKHLHEKTKYPQKGYDIALHCIEHPAPARLKRLLKNSQAQEVALKQLIFDHPEGKKCLLEIAHQATRRTFLPFNALMTVQAILAAGITVTTIAKLAFCPPDPQSIDIYTNILSSLAAGWLVYASARDCYYLKDAHHNLQLQVDQILHETKDAIQEHENSSGQGAV